MPRYMQSKRVSTYFAEVTATRLCTLPIMITAKHLVSFRSTARPSKGLPAILVHLLLVTSKLRLKLPLQIFSIRCKGIAPLYIVAILVFIDQVMSSNLPSCLAPSSHLRQVSYQGTLRSLQVLLSSSNVPAGTFASNRGFVAFCTCFEELGEVSLWFGAGCAGTGGHD